MYTLSSVPKPASTRPFKRTAPILVIFLLSLFAVGLFTLSLSRAYRAEAAPGDLTIEIQAAYNLIVDSNVSSPSTYAPRVATVAGRFCNESGVPMTNVYGYIGDHTAGTPGLYPTNNSWIIDPGEDYAFTHVGGAIGTADATRYIGDLAAGECKLQYWSFTYPACAHDGVGDPVEPPCTTTPTWGLSVKPDDDLSLDFDMWATADGPETADASWTMTMRNEISAMANKIRPNPDGHWFNTDTSTVVPGSVITTNGVLYTLGNVRQGFDNDGDFVPDYNAWLQPFGDPSYDPSCFRLIRATTTLTVSRSGGNPDLIIQTDDLNTHPIYGGPLYFTKLPPNNNGVRGEVRYTFLALGGPCSLPITPYQEVASGSDNEKFNGDYGTGIPTVQSSTPEVTISKSGPDSVALNTIFNYNIPFANQSTTSSAGLTLNSSGVNMPLVVRDTVPDGLEYIGGSAATGNTNPTGCASDCFTNRYSTDGGVTWSAADPGNIVSSLANPVVIEWWLTNPLPASGSGAVTFQARIPNAYTGSPFIVNEACVNFGGGADFACAEDVTMVLGNNSVGDFVWADVDTDGVQDLGEAGISGITVWLYWDANGDGLLDDGDLFIAETATNGSGGYLFNQLPDGNFLVVVDSADPDLPVGYANTTPAVIAVPLDPNNATATPVNVLTADFGFGPVLSLNKSLTSPNPAYEGELVTFDLELANNLPGDGTGQEISCEYIVWANNATTANAPKNFTNPTNMQGLPDGIYATGEWVGGSNEWAYGFNFDGLATLDVSNITQVEGLLPIYTTQALTNDFLSIHWTSAVIANNSNSPGTGAEATDAIPTATMNTYVNTPGVLSWVIWDLGVDGAWVWPSLNNSAWKLVVEPDKVGGSDGGSLFVDAVGLRITTSGGCGGPAGTIDPLPLFDNYDADQLEFVSASVAPSAVTTGGGSPYGNTGTISWNNVGPLHAGQTNTIQVTFRVLEPPGNAPDTTTNYAEVIGATFTNGNPVNEPEDQADVDIEPTGSISGVVWNDNGPTNGGIDGGEQGITGVTVNLCSALPCTGGNIIATTVTDDTGAYTFDGLQNGNYFTAVDTTTLPGGATQTGDPDQPGVVCGVCDHQTTNPVNVSGAADVTGVNYGYTVANYIYGIVWQDNDGDSNRDDDDDGINGVTVYLCTDGVNPCDEVAMATTNSSGAYLFSNVSNGDYYIQVANTAAPLGADWDNTRDPEGAPGNHQSAPIAVSGGNGYGSFDFGYHQTGPHDISGSVYADWNSNADFDGSDAGFGSVTVTLYGSNGSVIATTTTDASGNYSFPGLPDGTYTVVVDESDLPLHYSQTENYGEAGQCLICGGEATVIVSGGPVSGVDFGYEPAGYGTIGDRVWQDNNGDGYQNPGEPGIPDVTVNLWVDYGDGYVLVDSTVTGANVIYSSTNLPPGDYRVEVDTTDPDLPNDGYGNNYVPTTPVTVDVTLAAGQTYLDADFGFAPGGVIGNTIYWDANGNADQDLNELGIPGVTVQLYISNTTTLTWDLYDAQVTNSDGEYLFTGLPQGDYRVVVDTSSAPIDGRTLTGDPDTNGIPCFPMDTPFLIEYCDSEHEVDIRPGQTYLGANFGYQPTGVIGDYIWLDSNGDGTQDAAEGPIPFINVWLCATDSPCDVSTAILTTTTDTDGYYSFINVNAGTWYVAVDEDTLPAGLSPTYDLDSGTTNPDSITQVVLANQGDSNFDVDFGYAYIGIYSISGYVFDHPVDGNGDPIVRDVEGPRVQPGDLTYADVAVYLWRENPGGGYTLIAQTVTGSNGFYEFGNLPSGNYAVSVDGNDPGLNENIHVTGPATPNGYGLDAENNGMVFEYVEIVNSDLEHIDFGFGGSGAPTAVTLQSITSAIPTPTAVQTTLFISLMALSLATVYVFRRRRQYS